MNMTMKRLISLFCMLVLMHMLFPTVFAADRPSAADLEEIGSQIEYPKGNEFFDEYRYATVKAPHGHSVFGFGSADHLGSSYTVLDGERVLILAERKGYSCVIVLSQHKGRWINSDYLIPVDDDLPAEEWCQLSYAYYWKGEPYSQTQYFYSDGILTEYLHYSTGARSLWSIERNHQDETGRMIGSETTDPVTGEIVEYKVFNYSDNGNLKQVLTYSTDGSLIQEQNNTRTDSGGHVITEIILYEDDGSRSMHQVMERDVNGNLLKSDIVSSTSTNRQEIRYDEDGRAVSGHNVINLLNSGEIESEVTYEYGEDGCLLRTVETYLSGYRAGSQTITEYVYDEWGNQIEEHRLEDGEETSTTYIVWGLMINGEIVERSSSANAPELLECPA